MLDVRPLDRRQRRFFFAARADRDQRKSERSAVRQHPAGLRERSRGKENTLVLRHYYADIYLDSARTFRARVGQSEVPTGFEGLQSSSRRAPFDRADAMESSAPG